MSLRKKKLSWDINNINLSHKYVVEFLAFLMAYSSIPNLSFNCLYPLNTINPFYMLIYDISYNLKSVENQIIVYTNYKMLALPEF